MVAIRINVQPNEILPTDLIAATMKGRPHTKPTGNERLLTAIIRDVEIPVGAPANIRLYTDTQAAVVVKTTKTQVHVRRVEVGSSTTVEQKGPWPVIEAEGLLLQPIGEVIIFRVGKNGILATSDDRSITLGIGRSFSRTDYSF
jgi:hypothetical protein